MKEMIWHGRGGQGAFTAAKLLGERYENSSFSLTHKPKAFTDPSAYLKKQGRFRHLTQEDIETITHYRDKKWNDIDKHVNNK